MRENGAVAGTRAIFRINGKPVAYASDVSYNWNHNLQPVDVLDHPEVIEHAEVGMTIDFSCTMFRIANQSAIQLGIQPKLGALLRQPELVVSIIDKMTGAVMFSVSGVKLQSRSGSVSARGLWTENLSFVGRLAQGEAGA